MKNLKEAVKKIVMDEIAGYSREEVENYFEDSNNYCCIDGNVSALTWYEDTEKFAIKHHDEIIELMKENDIEPLNTNEMAWLGFEATVPKLKDEILKEMK